MHFKGLFTLCDTCTDTGIVLSSVPEMGWKPHYFPNSVKIRCFRIGADVVVGVDISVNTCLKGPFTLGERERGSQNFFRSLLPLNVNSAINLLTNHHKAILLLRSLSLSVSAPLGTKQ